MINIDRVTKSFLGTCNTLDSISLRVKEGEVLALVGASGCGKSVLLYMIAGLIESDQGEISLKQNNIGMLFQRNALFDSMTVKENLAIPLEELTTLSRKEISERVRVFLTHIGLEGREDSSISNLSGGMQKRLALARAMIADPDILLCDSPTAGLDPITARQIVKLLIPGKINRAKTTIIASHDVKRILPIADRVALLSGGKLEFLGTPNEFMASDHPAILAFLNIPMEENSPPPYDPTQPRIERATP